MELAVETTSFALMAAVCLICTKTDLEKGIISNRVLLGFSIAAVVVDAVHYGVVAYSAAGSFFLNVLTVAGIAFLLYALRLIAGGDCKLIIVLALLFPAERYLVIGDTDVMLAAAIAFSFVFGYLFLLGNAVRLLVLKKTTISASYVKDSVFNFVRTYVAALSYISLIGCAYSIAALWGLNVNVWIMRVSCLVMALCVGRFGILKNAFAFVPVVVCTVIASLLSHTVPISLNPSMWLLVLALLVCQTVIKTSLYESVAVDRLQAGMILSMFSSLVMQSSDMDGLPGVSTEKLKSRLTETEVESVKAWARAARVETLTIVKKVPFALFISLGFLLYCIVGGVLA